MTNAKRDNNQIPVMLGTSSTDGSTPVQIKVDPTTHAILIDDTGTGSDLSDNTAPRDNNGVQTILGVSNADGETTTPIYATESGGKLFIKTT